MGRCQTPRRQAPAESTPRARSQTAASTWPAVRCRARRSAGHPCFCGSGGVRLLELLDERGVRELVVGVFAAGVVADAARGAGRPADAESAGGVGSGAFSTITAAPPAAHTAVRQSAAVFAPRPASRLAPPPPAAAPPPTTAPPLAPPPKSPLSAPTMPPPAPTALASSAGAGTMPGQAAQATARRRRTPGIP